MKPESREIRLRSAASIETVGIMAVSELTDNAVDLKTDGMSPSSRAKASEKRRGEFHKHRRSAEYKPARNEF